MVVVAGHLIILGAFGLLAGLATTIAAPQWGDPAVDHHSVGIGILFVGFVFSGSAWAPFVAVVGGLSLLAGIAAWVGRMPLLVISALMAWIVVAFVLSGPDPDGQRRSAIVLGIGIAVVVWRWWLARPGGSPLSASR